MKKWFTLSTLTIISLSLHAQIFRKNVFDDAYRDTIKKASELHDEKQYQAAAEKYNQAFTNSGGKAMMTDKYDAACCLAMAGNIDSAMKNLNVIAGGRFTRYNQLMIDPELDALRNAPEWNTLCEKVKSNRLIGQTSLNVALMVRLDTIIQDDQKYRYRYEPTEKKYGRDSKEMQELIKVATYYDSLNTKKVTAILDTYGWPGRDVAGDEGNNAVFLVIQHAETPVQQKYLPMMRKAVKEGKARGSSLALLEDRVALAEGKKQLYGSQVGRTQDGVYFVDDIEDPENVDKRRAEVGLPPLADYLKNWDIKWDVNEHIKQQAAKNKK